MKYYKDGFYTGDPAIVPEPAAAADAPEPDEVDVLIVGAGPAGLVAGAVLARHPGISVRIVDRRPGPMELGQADGIACRTVEMFQAFGFAHTLLEEAYWVNETVFWRPDPQDRDHIVRTDRVQDVEDGLSEMPHLIMNQARIHDYLLESMANSATRLQPEYGLELAGVTVADDGDHPVEAKLLVMDTGEHTSIRAKYVVGADGARSPVRTALGLEMIGESANHAWGVIDMLAVTDFPDIRFKAAIQSGDKGSILLIPREGGYMVRLYVDLGTITEENRWTVRGMSAEQILEVANRVLHPYSIDVKETVWFSVYEVGQRIAEAFDDSAGGTREPRVFIAGDACHTHSAKAGQGMNVSMQDSFNLAWKLAAVLEGVSEPSLLESYDAERRPVAQELIDFDKQWSSLLAATPFDPEHPERGGVSTDEVSAYFVRQGRYTAGVATRYAPSSLTGAGKYQSLATGLPVGMRFHSAPVTRVADGKRVELGHAATVDGRWRLYAFADGDESRFRALCEWLVAAADSPLRRSRARGSDIDAVIDVLGIVQRHPKTVELAGLPELLRPRTGALGLVDYEKAFSATASSSGKDIYDIRGISRTAGALIVVRPDQFIADVLPLDAVDELARYFEGILRQTPAIIEA